MMRLAGIALILVLLAFVPWQWDKAGLRVGSKKFTESVILGDMLVQLARQGGATAVHLQELGGTRLVYDALADGQIDIYPEYTGTIVNEIFAGQNLDSAGVENALAREGIAISRPLGFNNTYALAMVAERANELGIRTISDLRTHPDLRLGFSNEFMQRADGWPRLRQHYALPQTSVTGLAHELAYEQLKLGAIDVVDVYTTDARIERLGLQVLADDQNYFPRYDAVLLYRVDLQARFPQALAEMLRLQGKLSEAEMLAANAQAELDQVPEPQVAATWLRSRLGLETHVAETSVAARIASHAWEHIDLVRRSLIPAILFAIPLGVWAAKRRRLGQVILAAVGLVQTIPSLALLVLIMPVVAAIGLGSVGIGSATAVLALFLYSLLPIVRNTHASLVGIPANYREAAAALGLPAGARLTKIELPLATPGILAGIKTAAVINVGFATLGALVGAGGFGQPILTGIRLANTSLILQGAIPAAVLALAVQFGFDLLERWVTPRGLRIHSTTQS